MQVVDIEGNKIQVGDSVCYARVKSKRGELVMVFITVSTRTNNYKNIYERKKIRKDIK